MAVSCCDKRERRKLAGDRGGDGVGDRVLTSPVPGSDVVPIVGRVKM